MAKYMIMLLSIQLSVVSLHTVKPVRAAGEVKVRSWKLVLVRVEGVVTFISTQNDDESSVFGVAARHQFSLLFRCR
jgi:hypothetical protein